ncbi:MAG: restriction endonuclease subunit S [Anaerovoracaceae bacterium]
MNEWKEVKLGDVINFNPREGIPKNVVAKKIGMEQIKPFTKFIESYEMAGFKGGTKFRNGDTLLARITPCLENGKTAQVTELNDDEIGFGSTEYIVLREKEDQSNKDFIYYLSISPAFRDIAIKSMVGTSGRQRVQQDVLENAKFIIPPLPEQKSIADTLSCLDDKIEINNKINKNLEAQAQAIFKSWFVDFDPFQDGEFVDSEIGRIPKGWRVGTLGEVADIASGKRPLIKVSTPDFIHNVPIIGASSIMGYTNQTLYNQKILVTGRVGTHGIIQRCYLPCWASDNTLVVKSNFFEFVYQILSGIDFKSMNRGSTQPLITQTDLKNVSVLVPSDSILDNFEIIATSLMNITQQNQQQTQTLTTLRDTLLPKLMSGEIRVPVEVE